MTKKERERFEFIQRTAMVLASGVALKRPGRCVLQLRRWCASAA
jgi:hypothetical protein